ncbi:DUF72 domain-containing protein [Bdellovibrio sp. HCB-162]|uniref:DUF72 domain-containing protein n=1 Tax=Bdellovibrio sp. HCB-162 TaxID=3394234 RepID=UPI0039BD49C2
MEIRIGISGWLYPPWRKIFYPADLPQKKELAYASRQVSSIEINGSFYHYQKPESYQRWYSETPKDFVFSVKGPQYITHIRRLREIEMPLANFFASGVLYLDHKLGCFLWQFPPSFLYNEERLETFFKLLPRTFSEAAKLSDKSDRFSPEYPAALRKQSRELRHAIEIRHHSFENPFFIELVRKYNIAIVFADTAGKWPYIEDVTADFLYLRLHGDEEIYKSGYDIETLNWWADRIKIWSKGKLPKDALNVVDLPVEKRQRDVYVYFDNDIKVRAPEDAQTLMKLLKVKKTQEI